MESRLMNRFSRSSLALILVTAVVCLAPVASQAIDPYSQDFETMWPEDFAALVYDGWLVWGNVSTPEGDLLYYYGPFPAPNNPGTPAFSVLAVGEGGVEQGYIQLSVFSDYENPDHANGYIIESNVYQEQMIGAADVGTTWRFDFDAKRGNIEGNSTAAAFIKTVDPDDNYGLSNFITADMTFTPITWTGYSLWIVISPSLEGHLLQIGFMNWSTLYEGSAIFYDNINFYMADLSDLPIGTATSGAYLHQNAPNPFNPATTISYDVPRPGCVALRLYDLSGQLIRTLADGDFVEAGRHGVIWNGQDDSGRPVPSGAYLYRLTAGDYVETRRMTLIR
jgi:hypothetical protein